MWKEAGDKSIFKQSLTLRYTKSSPNINQTAAVSLTKLYRHWVYWTNLSMKLCHTALEWLFNYVQECYGFLVWSYSCFLYRRTLHEVALVITTEKKEDETPTYSQPIIIKTIHWAAAELRSTSAHVKQGMKSWKRPCTFTLPFINKLTPEYLNGQFPVEKW